MDDQKNPLLQAEGERPKEQTFAEEATAEDLDTEGVSVEKLPL